jgi:hypothetical protein
VVENRSSWQEIAVRKAERAPETSGVVEFGRTPAWPNTTVFTMLIEGVPNIQKAILDEMANRTGDLTGAQYFRYSEAENFEAAAKEALTEFASENGGDAPQVNASRSE